MISSLFAFVIKYHVNRAKDTRCSAACAFGPIGIIQSLSSIGCIICSSAFIRYVSIVPNSVCPTYLYTHASQWR
jgi:hypothetical protein